MQNGIFRSTSILFICCAIVFFGCGENKPQEAAKETPLNFGVEVENTYMRTTGEVVVFFEPSEQRLATLRETTPDIDSKLESFKAFKAKAIELCKERKLNYTESNQDDVKLTVTDSQITLINVANIPEGFGVIIGRVGKQPAILRGIANIEEFTSNLEQK